MQRSNKGHLQKEKILETLLKGIGDAICIYDLNCKVLLESAHARELFGESFGKPCLNKTQCVRKSKDTGEPFAWTETRADVHHHSKTYSISVFPIQDESGKKLGCIHIAKDISAQLELEAKTRELEQIRKELEGNAGFENIVGRSSVMRKIFDAIQVVAPLETTVLIQGETGTGKELVARAIHKRSLRSEKPFIAVSCGALPETLLESELFGHVKGAFTGAIADKIGLFQEANQGTIFLDEISETSPATQVKLLRVLQEGEIRRVGSTKDEKVDVRILAASNSDLETLVREGMLREDLFYRLNVFPVYLPPLKDRQDDVLILAEHFMKLFSLKNHKKIGAISKNAQEVLQSYPWPGNVRELANVIERAVILAKDETITENELLLSGIKSSKDRTFLTGEAVMPETLASMSRLKIQEALDKNRGNKTQTARELGISRTTLWRRIKEERSAS